MLPELYYSESTNFNRKPKGTKRPYVPGFKVKILDLLRPDWEYVLLTIEQRINVLLWLYKTAYPFKKSTMYNGLSSLMQNERKNGHFLLTGSAYQISKAIQHKIVMLLLSLNVDNDVWIWRVNTGFSDINHIIDVQIRSYRYRAAMPIKAFTSLDDLVNKILDTKINLLGWAPNSSHTDAVVIKEKGFSVSTMDYWYYFIISYTSPDHLNGGWEIYIKSGVGETFTDFVLRLNENHYAIFNTGDCLVRDGKYSPYFNLK